MNILAGEEHNGLFISTTTDRTGSPVVKKKEKERERGKKDKICPLLVFMCVLEIHYCRPTGHLDPLMLLGMLWGSGAACALAVGFCLACPFTWTFYLVEKGGCSQRTALGIVLRGANPQLLFEILNWTDLSKPALFACICPSKSAPHTMGFWSFLVHICLYIAMLTVGRKQWLCLICPLDAFKTHHLVQIGAALLNSVKWSI